MWAENTVRLGFWVFLPLSHTTEHFTKLTSFFSPGIWAAGFILFLRWGNGGRKKMTFPKVNPAVLGVRCGLHEIASGSCVNRLAISGRMPHRWVVLDAAPALSANFPKVRMFFNLIFLSVYWVWQNLMNACNSHQKLEAWWCRPEIHRMPRENHKFKVCLGCWISSRPALSTLWDVSK